MGPVAYFSLCLLGCLIFNPSLEEPFRCSAPHLLELRTRIGATNCRHGWLYYQGHCYGFFPIKLTWSDAELECQHHRKGAHLASIRSAAEGNSVARFITRTGYTDYVWIGLHDPEQIRHWRWSDGSLFRYNAWKPTEPNNKDNAEYCVELLSYLELKQWNDENCAKENAYVCKYELERRK